MDAPSRPTSSVSVAVLREEVALARDVHAHCRNRKRAALLALRVQELEAALAEAVAERDALRPVTQD